MNQPLLGTVVIVLLAGLCVFVWAVLSSQGAKFKNKFGISLDSPDAEEQLRSLIVKLSQMVADEPNAENINDLHRLIHAADQRGFLDNW